MIEISLKAPVDQVNREHKEEPHLFRTEFMRDRDRILYSKALRRLSGKTQIFINTFDDHARTRLTHSLEVSQIARTIAYRLNLDDNLVEAMALGHDLGHTPFGHSGERTLNYILNGCDDLADIGTVLCDDMKGFKHNLQSLRVVAELEKTSEHGMNLTNYTLFGIKYHSDDKWKDCNKNSNKCTTLPKVYNCTHGFKTSVGFYDKYNSLLKMRTSDELAWSFEALIVAISDEIAQRHHDIEDGLIAELVSPDEVIEKIKVFNPFLITDEDKINYNNIQANFNKVTKNNKHHFISELSRFVVNLLVNQLVESFERNVSFFLKKYDIKTENDFINTYPEINFKEIEHIANFESNFEQEHKNFKDYFKQRILNSFSVQRMDGKGKFVIRRLFKAYLTNPQQLPDKTIKSLYFILYPSKSQDNIGIIRNEISNIQKDNQFKIALLRVIGDYISGMTDSYAIKEYEQLYG